MVYQSIFPLPLRNIIVRVVCTYNEKRDDDDDDDDDMYVHTFRIFFLSPPLAVIVFNIIYVLLLFVSSVRAYVDVNNIIYIYISFVGENNNKI